MKTFDLTPNTRESLQEGNSAIKNALAACEAADRNVAALETEQEELAKKLARMNSEVLRSDTRGIRQIAEAQTQRSLLARDMTEANTARENSINTLAAKVQEAGNLLADTVAAKREAMLQEARDFLTPLFDSPVDVNHCLGLSSTLERLRIASASLRGKVPHASQSLMLLAQERARQCDRLLQSDWPW